MEKRVALAIVLSLLVVVGFGWLNRKLYPPAQAPPAGQGVPVAPEPAARRAETIRSVPPVPQDERAAVPTPPAEGPATDAEAARRITATTAGRNAEPFSVETNRFVVTFDPTAAAITRIVMAEFEAALTDDPLVLFEAPTRGAEDQPFSGSVAFDRRNVTIGGRDRISPGDTAATTPETSGTGGTATRSLPQSYMPGHPCEVSIDVVPDAAVKSYTVIDRPPTGWLVRDINQGGAWDHATGRVKWGPFSDNKARTLGYKVTSPPALGEIMPARKDEYDLAGSVWEYDQNEKEDTDVVTFRLSLTNGLTITKAFTLYRDKYAMDCAVTVSSSVGGRSFQYWLAGPTGISAEDRGASDVQAIVAAHAPGKQTRLAKVRLANLLKDGEKTHYSDEDGGGAVLDWMGLRNKYFIGLVAAGSGTKFTRMSLRAPADRKTAEGTTRV